MSKLNRFFSTAVLLFSAAAVFGQDDTRPTATWQVQKYEISATLPPADSDRKVTVRAKIDVKNVSVRPAATLTLRIASNAEVTAVKVGETAAEPAKSEEKVNATTNLQRLVLRLPSVQPNGTVSATVDYKFAVKDNTGISALSPMGAQFLPTSFWYPTPNSWFFARGADFAPFRLQVSSGGRTVISSGVETAGAFDQKLHGQPFFVAGAWDTINAGGVSVMVPKGAGAEEQKRAAEMAAIASEAKAFTATLLGTAPDVPLRIVAVQRGGGFSGGGTIFVDEGALRRSKIDSQTAMSIADAVAKFWLGNAITVTGDGFGVIREGLAKFIATQFVESKFGKDVADVERLRQRTAYSAIAKRDAPLNLVSPLDDYYYAAVANKGAMIWRLLGRRAGQDEMFSGIRAQMADKDLTLAEIRASNVANKEILDYLIDQVTDADLMAGIPSRSGADWKVALRNTGPVDITVNVQAVLANGEKMAAPATIKATSFGEIVFKTPQNVVRAEVDPEKVFPQSDYSDDVAPRDVTDSDLQLAVKRPFDQQKYADAEATARIVLRDFPRFDEVRALLARSLLAQNKTADAEKEFRAVLEEKLPTARSIAWANVGLADISQRAGKNTEAIKFAEDAIRSDAEYGASLAARAIRNKIGASAATDESVKAFFSQFDKAAVSNRKAELETMAVPGDVTRFISGISGQAVEWKTAVLHIDKIDPNNIWVETSLAIKLLNKEPSSGMAVFRLTKIGSGWKLSGVDIFEVR
ncbi:MAG: tetratricopeptide repeat protein [Acidobacteria bacterium]|nr:tetratricopeptide repeat protein [Acidobacteriota bacterium]